MLTEKLTGGVRWPMARAGPSWRAWLTGPGLWGNWITGNMNWNGDYHTNYNYQTPFYAALSTNHIDQIGAYDKPVLDWQSAAQSLASQNGFTGVLYPVGISPNATSADMNLHNQKSNAANLASDMVMRYEYTHDTGYANTVYPWLKQVGLFWQNYLTFDSARNRYVITNDAPHEDQSYPQTNSGIRRTKSSAVAVRAARTIRSLSISSSPNAMFSAIVPSKRWLSWRTTPSWRR